MPLHYHHLSPVHGERQLAALERDRLITEHITAPSAQRGHVGAIVERDDKQGTGRVLSSLNVILHAAFVGVPAARSLCSRYSFITSVLTACSVR